MIKVIVDEEVLAEIEREEYARYLPSVRNKPPIAVGSTIYISIDEPEIPEVVYSDRESSVFDFSTSTLDFGHDIRFTEWLKEHRPELFL